MLSFFKSLSNKKLFALTALLVGVNFFLIQKGVDFNSWRSVMRSDQAGYYMYLPATFIYHFDVSKIQNKDSLLTQTGNGFAIEDNKFKTKYPVGVAILQAPAFLIFHAIAKTFSFNADGFSPIYHFVIYLSAFLYFLLGVYFLFKFLKPYVSRKFTIITIFIITYGTNIYYYVVDTSGMSHVYSFFLFSAILFFSDKFWKNPKRYKYFYFSTLLLALAIVVRPTNILISFVVLFWNISNYQELKNRIIMIFGSWKFLLIIISVFIIFSAQLFYWKYLSGNFMYYAYENEGFNNALSPKILQVLFAPKSGLIPYNPIVLIFIIASINYFHKSKNAIIISGVFVVALYLTASWHTPVFGCSYGCRNLSEYMVLFSLPLALFLNKIQSDKTLIKQVIYTSIIIFVLLNQRLAYAFDKCYFYDLWDYTGYLRYII